MAPVPNAIVTVADAMERARYIGKFLPDVMKTVPDANATVADAMQPWRMHWKLRRMPLHLRIVCLMGKDCAMKILLHILVENLVDNIPIGGIYCNNKDTSWGYLARRYRYIGRG